MMRGKRVKHKTELPETETSSRTHLGRHRIRGILHFSNTLKCVDIRTDRKTSENNTLMGYAPLSNANETKTA